MTGVNHALTGAVISLAIKQPWLSLPLAFASHFAADLIPHYNPPNLTRDTFTSYAASWSAKMKLASFRLIFSADMVLLVASLVFVPYAATNARVSPFTVFACMVLAILPDFVGGFNYLRSLVGPIKHKKNNDLFSRFHIAIQWKEFPNGIWIEAAWFVLMAWLIVYLSRPVGG